MLLAARPVGGTALPSWLDVRGRLYGLAIVDTGGGPRQRPEATGVLEVDATPIRSLRSFVQLRSRAGGPFEGGSGPALYNLNHAFQNYSPALEARQAFLEWRGRRAEVRAGIQTFAWGKLDGVPPTDVLNPRDWHDPFVVDEYFEEQKIGVPALLGTGFLPDLPWYQVSGLRLALAWLPWAVPSRLPLIEERWFPRTLILPDDPCVPIPLPDVRQGRCDAGRTPVAIAFRTANDAPARTLAAGAIAARLSGTWRVVDVELSHYTGVDTGPDATLDAVAVLGAGGAAGRAARAMASLTQANHTMHMTGAAVAAPAGPITVRAEVAWFVDRGFLRPADDLVAPLLAGRFGPRVVERFASGRPTAVPLGPLFPRLDAVEWGIGADTLWRGIQPLLQVNQIVVLGDAPPLLIANPETRLSGTLRRRFAGDRVEAEVRGLWEIERGALYLFPRVSWQARDNLWLRAGYLVLTGPRTSVIGQFRANDEVVVQARLTF